MWYIATLVRGLPVDEAIRQLKFIARGGASHAREVLEQAKELAKKEHNVEYPSDMWVGMYLFFQNKNHIFKNNKIYNFFILAEAFATKGNVIKGLRRHARCRPGIIEYWYCHFFVRLEEGIPPDNYYKHPTTDPKEQLENWLKGIRKRKIINSL